MKKNLLIAMLCCAAAVSCSVDKQEFTPDKPERSPEYTRGTADPKEYIVTEDDVMDYLYTRYYAIDQHVYDFEKTENLYDLAIIKKRYNPKSSDVTFTAYPAEGVPSIYIVNYAGEKWEIISSDKRTAPVIGIGNGKLDLDECTNTNMVGWIRDLADEIAYLHSYSGRLKNAEANISLWDAISEHAEWIKFLITNYPHRSKPVGFGGEGAVGLHTRSEVSNIPCVDDTTQYHPVPGHWVLYTMVTFTVHSDDSGHLVSTKWSEDAPYNQYCPKDYENRRAKAGSDAVAGGQIVKYMHTFTGDYPGVFSGAHCEAYFNGTDEIDWSYMEQTDQSPDNWSLFQTSDSTRMAAVLLANIGTSMHLHYGLRNSWGYFDDLQYALSNIYGLTSFNIPFNSTDVDPYNEIQLMLYSGIPSIVHSGGSEGYPPYTFIVDRYEDMIKATSVTYAFIADDPALWGEYYAISPTYLICDQYLTNFGMNWGMGGQNDEALFINSDAWHVYDASSREALLSFRRDGSQPGDDVQ